MELAGRGEGAIRGGRRLIQVVAPNPARGIPAVAQVPGSARQASTSSSSARRAATRSRVRPSTPIRPFNDTQSQKKAIVCHVLELDLFLQTEDMGRESGRLNSVDAPGRQVEPPVGSETMDAGVEFMGVEVCHDLGLGRKMGRTPPPMGKTVRWRWASWDPGGRGWGSARPARVGDASPSGAVARLREG
jgi:hypothetical protein